VSVKRALAVLAPLLALAPLVAVVLVVLIFGRGDARVVVSLLGSILRGAVPLLLCGLAVTIGFRGGALNLGAEGQLIVGAVAAAAVGTKLPLGPLLLPAELIAGALAGALWASCAAWLKEKRGAPEVLTTILLNFIAIQVARFLIDSGNPLNEAAGREIQSDALPDSGVISPIPLFGVDVPPGLLLAILLGVLLERGLFATRPGLELRLAGTSPGVARAQGFSARRALWTAFVLGGALAGLAGALGLAGVTRRLYMTIGEGAGYTAVAVALVADLRPVLVIGAALAFAALETATMALQREHGIPHTAASAIEGLVILAVLARNAYARLRGAPA
jgi:simple sugar transport system permease protein